MKRVSCVRAVALVVACGLIAVATALLAASPVVSNVQFTQRPDGSRLVDVVYDLADADGDLCAITLLASDDGGAEWSMPCTRYWGDAGTGVAPGAGKQIVWDVGYDNPGWEGNDYRVRVAASDRGVLCPSHSPRLYAINDWMSIDWTVPGQFEKYARADLVVLTANFLWGNPQNEALHVIDRIKAINPRCRVLGYVPGTTTDLASAGGFALLPFYATWFERTRPYWAYTTLGDTLMNWPGQVVIDLTNPDCRAAMVSTIAEFQQNSNNKFDGLFWDYFNSTIWIAPWVVWRVLGQPDFDRDGVAMASDPGEIAAYRAGEEALIQAVRQTMGDGFIQVFNGQRAYADSAFAALGDGMFYEMFPAVFFPQPERMRAALDPAFPYNIFRTINWPRRDNGGPFNILADWQISRYYDDRGVLTDINVGNHLRAVGLLADTYAAWNPYGKWSYGWTNVDINLGSPLGPPVIAGNNYSRDFKYGRIELIMDSGVAPDAFDYTIWVNGRVVEHWAMPHHLP